MYVLILRLKLGLYRYRNVYTICLGPMIGYETCPYEHNSVNQGFASYTPRSWMPEGFEDHLSAIGSKLVHQVT